MTAETNEPKAFSHIFSSIVTICAAFQNGLVPDVDSLPIVGSDWFTAAASRWKDFHCIALRMGGEARRRRNQEKPREEWLTRRYERYETRVAALRGTAGCLCSRYWVSFLNPYKVSFRGQMAFTPPQVNLILLWRISLKDDKDPFNSLFCWAPNLPQKLTIGTGYKYFKVAMVLFSRELCGINGFCRSCTWWRERESWWQRDKLFVKLALHIFSEVKEIH